MLVDETTQTNAGVAGVLRKTSEARTIKEGTELWRRRLEEAKVRKYQEQKEMRDMMERYWPFGRSNEIKPRGLRNLRLEGLFPNQDFVNAKRFVGTLDLGRPGGGAPLVSDTGKKLTRTREDPLLRFQFGSHDLRRCVDNTLRYKTNRRAQDEYRRELDKLVEDKKQQEERRKIEDQKIDQDQFLKTSPWGRAGPGGLPWRKPNEIGKNFFQSLGWSSEKTLKQLNSEGPNKDRGKKDSDKFKLFKVTQPNKERKLDPIFYPCKNVYVGSRNKKLSPLQDSKDNGIELVPILARQRRYPLKINLDSTDVTNEKKYRFSTLWNRQGSAYLKELTKQIVCKQEKFKEMKAKENEIVERHFSTWDGFWGRPGHGAPRSAFKKQRLDTLLYPQMVPIGVH